jgi:hypothetical protein
MRPRAKLLLGNPCHSFNDREVSLPELGVRLSASEHRGFWRIPDADPLLALRSE